MTELREELVKLQKKLNCNRILFAIIAVLMSVVTAIMASILLIIGFTLLTVAIVVITMFMPFVVLYQCIITRCNFESESDNYGNN